MGENFSRKEMWRLNTNSNSLVDKLMSTFTDEKCRRNKRMTSTVLCKSQPQVCIRKNESRIWAKFWKRRKLMFCHSFLLRLTQWLTYFSFLSAYLWAIWYFLYLTFLLLLKEIRRNSERRECISFFEVRLNGCLPYFACYV